MTEEERRIISGYVERVSGAAAAQPAATSAGPWGARSVPNTQAAPNLPPVDPEADRLIADLFTRYPEARYRITQTAFVQEAALVQAQNRIQELEWQLENTQRQAQAQAQGSRGGLFGGMFGGGRPQQVPMTPRPQPIQPPMGAMSPGMMQQGGGGSGFLGTALTTAAGVAGGMVLGNMMMGMFSGGGAHAATAAAGATPTADAGGAGGFGEQAVNTPSSSPWTDPGSAGNDASPVSDQGGWGNDAASYNDASSVDNGGGYDDAAGYDDAGGFDEDV